MVLDVLNNFDSFARDLAVGLTGIKVDLEEPYAVQQGYKSDYAVLETKQIVETVKAKLASYWNCFASS